MRHTRRRVLKLVGTTSALGLAGCSSTPSDTTQTPGRASDSTQTPDQATESAQTPQATDGTQTTTGESELTYPDGYSEKGITDIDAIVSAHREYLRSLPNYTERWTVKSITASGDIEDGQPTELTVRAAPEKERVRLHYHDHANNVEVFYDGTYYEYDLATEKLSEGESPRLFTRVEKRYQPLAFYGVNILLPSLLNVVRVEPAGERTVRGTTGVQFDVIGVSDSRKSQTEDVTFTGADGKLVVTDSGGIVEFDYTPQFNSDSTSLQTATSEVGNVGETTVPRPNWLG